MMFSSILLGVISSIVGLTSTATVPSGQDFATAVKSDFDAASNTFNKFVFMLNAIKTKRISDTSSNLLHEVPAAVFSDVENSLLQIANVLHTVGKEFGNDINTFGSLYKETVITPNGYIEMSKNVQQLYLKIVNNLKVITFELASEFNRLGHDVEEIQQSIEPIYAQTVKTFFQNLIEAIDQAANSFTYGGNAWKDVYNYLLTKGTIKKSGSGETSILYSKVKFDTEIGGDFQQMLKAFSGISSSLAVLKSGIDNLEEILLKF